MTVEEWAKDFKSYTDELQIPRDDYKGIIAYIKDGVELLKDSIIPVRCYECIHRGTSRCALYNDYNDYYTNNPGLVSDWFCADGERR